MVSKEFTLFGLTKIVGDEASIWSCMCCLQANDVSIRQSPPFDLKIQVALQCQVISEI